MMSPTLRRFAYTAHITSSLGWIGAVIVFVAMAAIALTSQDETTVRGTYLIMAPAAWFVLVPLAHTSLLTGIVLSLGTPWGLLRHYWVVLKLGITVFCTVILMIYMGTFRQMAGVAADPAVNLDLVRNVSPLLHAIIALVLLVTAAVLGVYKPVGLTAYGRRTHAVQRNASSRFAAGRRSMTSVGRTSTPGWLYVAGALVVAAILLFVRIHLVSGGPRHH